MCLSCKIPSSPGGRAVGPRIGRSGVPSLPRSGPPAPAGRSLALACWPASPSAAGPPSSVAGFWIPPPERRNLTRKLAYSFVAFARSRLARLRPGQGIWPEYGHIFATVCYGSLASLISPGPFRTPKKKGGLGGAAMHPLLCSGVVRASRTSHRAARLPLRGCLPTPPGFSFRPSGAEERPLRGRGIPP